MVFGKIKGWQQGRSEKKVDKLLATIKNRKAIKDDRWMAIEFFKNYHDKEVAARSLLERFDFSIEHGIQDTREKEGCMEGIIEMGPEILPIVREKLKSTTRIAWPIKILKKLGDEDTVIEVLKDSLNYGDVDFDQNQVDKNYDILCYLRDYKVPGFAEKIAHFLNDHDERVRFAAVEMLIEQDEPEVPGMLEKYLDDSSSENTRIRNAVVEAFVRYPWKISDPSKYSGGIITEGIFATKDGQVERRG